MSNPSADKILTYLSTLARLKMPCPWHYGLNCCRHCWRFNRCPVGSHGLGDSNCSGGGDRFPMANAHFRITGQKDASEVIIDEVGGQWLAMLPIPVATALA